jgi:hypothetical protein|tara:strand:+ start:179 stop:448 length:270 start_codon:yes stop_codon:yes gene_type:complete
MYWGAPPILARFAWDSPSFAARERDMPPPRVMAQLGGGVESASWTATRTKRCPAHGDKSIVGPNGGAQMVREFAHSKEWHFRGRANFEQ